MNYLSLETASNRFSVALQTNGCCVEHTTMTTREQAQIALPTIEKLLLEANLTLQQLDFIALGAGPGSFTGLRIASSIAQGLAFSNNLPVVLISSLQACAQSAYDALKKPNILVGFNAYMKEIYWGVYQANNEGIMQATTPDSLCPPNAVFTPSEGQWVGVGDAWEFYGDLLKQQCQPDSIEIEHYPTAKAVSQLAQIEFAKGRAVTAGNALPVYLRGKTAWENDL